MRLSGRLVIPLTLTLLALLSWLSSPIPVVHDRPFGEVERVYGGGRLEQQDGLRSLHLSGTPYEMGYQHGVLLRHEIRAGLREQVHERLVLEQGVPHLLLLRHARHVGQYLPSKYREEMRGLADGAGISYSDVLLLNSLHDLIAQPLPGQQIRDLLLALDPPFIPPLSSADVLSAADSSPHSSSTGSAMALTPQTAFAAFGAATQDGRLLQGVEFASPQLSLGDILLTVYQPQNGNSFASLSWPGWVGVTIGLNEEKIAVVELASPSQDASFDGIPLPFLLRDLLETVGDIDAALRLVASAGRTVGHNVVIGDGKPADAQAVEYSAHLYAVFEAENGLVIRTNHFLDPALSKTQQAFQQDDRESSQDRFDTMSESLATDYGRLDPSKAINLLGESRGENGEEREIVAGVVIASSDLELWVVSVAHPEGRVVPRGLRLD